MKKKTAIKDRRDGSLTSYYPSGKKTIAGIGEFPSVIRHFFDDDHEIITSFKLAAITADFIYYADEEGDDTSGVVMLTRGMKLVSDNFFGGNDLTGVVEANDGLLWMANFIKYWQREQYVKPSLITPEIKGILEQVDIKKLSKKEKAVFFAYLDNGPVKYSKPESLMAVMSNDLEQEQYSPQLAAIIKMLPKKGQNRKK